jgi:hypothetical protein
VFSLAVDGAPSLDHRYLEFNARTQAVFEQYPQIEPIRVSIFKELLVGRDRVGVKDRIKHWVRPLVRRNRSQGPLGRVDVVLFVEGQRDVIVDALLPVHAELCARGVRTALVSSGGPESLPAGTIRFSVPAAASPPVWAFSSWEMLSAAVEGLHDASLKKSYYYYCAATNAMLEECSRVLTALEPQIVLTASNPLEGGVAMAVTARGRGTLALQMQHGILQPFYTPVIADHMLTWGRTSSETLERLGVPRHKLSVLGSPRHDAMASAEDGSSRPALLKALDLPDRPTLAFFSNGNDLVRNGHAPAECAAWLENVAAEHERDLNVIVRLHPNEDGSLYRDCPHLCVTKDTIDLGTMLDGCDCVASLCSTVLYDALLYRKPVWQFCAEGWPELAHNWKRGLARRISSNEELSKAVEMMLLGGSSCVLDENLCEQVFANHRRAAQAVADFVENRL